MSGNAATRQKWVAMLAKLCCPMDAATAAAAFAAMLPLLRDFDDSAFTEGSLLHVAAQAKRVPSYAELRGLLAGWVREHPRPVAALPDNLTSLTDHERQWLAYWHRRELEGFAPLREPDGRLSRPDVTDWREFTASLVRRMAPGAWQMVA